MKPQFRNRLDAKRRRSAVGMPFPKFALRRPRLEKRRSGFPRAHFFQNVVELRDFDDLSFGEMRLRKC